MELPSLLTEAEQRENAGRLLALASDEIEGMMQSLRLALADDRSLAASHYEWTSRLDALRRDILAASIVAGAGHAHRVSLPDDAAPGLQRLVRARGDLPDPTYDHLFEIVIKRGRAIVQSRDRRDDRWECLGGPKFVSPVIVVPISTHASPVVSSGDPFASPIRDPHDPKHRHTPAAGDAAISHLAHEGAQS